MSKVKTKEIEPIQDKNLTEREAANYLGYKMNTLAHWRMKGKGPKFNKLSSGVIRYKLSALDAYLESESVNLADEKAG